MQLQSPFGSCLELYKNAWEQRMRALNSPPDDTGFVTANSSRGNERYLYLTTFIPMKGWQLDFPGKKNAHGIVCQEDYEWGPRAERYPIGCIPDELSGETARVNAGAVSPSWTSILILSLICRAFILFKTAKKCTKTLGKVH